MDPQTSGGIVEIKPSTGYLGVAELIAQRGVKVEDVRSGLKRSVATGSEEEKQELERLHAGLERQLKVPRIERLGGRSLGVWDPVQQAVRIERKDGKFETFGYNHNGKLYLEYYEALFLLELDRLQLEYKGMTMSVEQAYLLLLGEEPSEKQNEYLVYSFLSRAGYIVIRHTDVYYGDSEKDCIWPVLRNAIEQRQVPPSVESLPIYRDTKESMDRIKEKIIRPGSPKEEQDDQEQINQPTGSRTADKISFQRKITHRSTKVLPKWNMREFSKPQAKQSFLDFLKNDAEYKKYKLIFESFSVIPLNRYACYSNDCRDLKISYGLHCHSRGFRKSQPTAPTFRVIIVGPNDPFPTQEEIVKCYRTQKHCVPLQVVSVSHSKQIQGFLYRFT